MAHVSDCAETLLKKRRERMWVSAPCLVALSSAHHSLLISHRTLYGRGRLAVGPSFFLQMGLIHKSLVPIETLFICGFFRRTQLINEISSGAVRSVSTQRQWFTEALREVFCHFVSALIKEWQPYIHDYIPCYLLWLQGQTNKPCTSAITFFIKPPCSYFPNTRLWFSFLYTSRLLENI